MEPSQRVIFKRWRAGGSVIAFLPDDTGVNPGMMTSYMHVGQHSEADYYGLLAETQPAKPEEYAALLQELKSIGYNLRIVKRLNRR